MAGTAALRSSTTLAPPVDCCGPLPSARHGAADVSALAPGAPAHRAPAGGVAEATWPCGRPRRPTASVDPALPGAPGQDAVRARSAPILRRHFVVMVCGDTPTMPGLPARPAAEGSIWTRMGGSWASSTWPGRAGPDIRTMGTGHPSRSPCGRLPARLTARRERTLSVLSVGRRKTWARPSHVGKSRPIRR